jgi:hypothetical protein
MSEPNEQIMQYFDCEHLPTVLQEVSRPFGVLANFIVATAPRNAERTVALRKLLEAKDAAVRAMLAKPVPWGERASGPVDPSEYKGPGNG